MRIAAVIPLYNGSRFIEEAIQSVLAQTRKVDEIVVVDDGSTDDGAAVVQRMSKECPAIVLVSQPNGGQGSARNAGVRKSTCDLIALLDQDDAWYPHHIELLEKPFLKKKRYMPLGYTYSDLDEIDERGRMFRRALLTHLPHQQHPKQTVLNCLRRDMFILPGASLISKEAFESVGGFDERLIGYEDDDLFIRLFCAGFDSEFINRPLSKWRIYQGSTSYTSKMARSRKVYFEKLLEAFPDNPDMGRFYARDLLVLRFLPPVIHDLFTALRHDRGDLKDVSIQMLRMMAPRARWRHRVRIYALLAMAGTPGMASTVNMPVARMLVNRRLRRLENW